MRSTNQAATRLSRRTATSACEAETLVYWEPLQTHCLARYEIYDDETGTVVANATVFASAVVPVKAGVNKTCFRVAARDYWNRVGELSDCSLQL